MYINGVVARTVDCASMTGCWRWMESLSWDRPTSTPWRCYVTPCTTLVRSLARSASP